MSEENNNPDGQKKETAKADFHKLDIHKIMAMLPHRYPILLVDRVLELVPGTSIKALKNVSINEPYFVGHFPSRPVMPGVLILEALAQAAALLTFSDEGECHDPATTLYYFVGIDGARFKQVVEPGDQLILNVKVLRQMRGIWKFQATASVDGKVAAEAELMCTIKHIEKPAPAAPCDDAQSAVRE
jgi:3-hydroxyacyl-[acyl-carrier-protein] dehydratase